MGINLFIFNVLNSLAFRYVYLDSLIIFTAKYLPYVLILAVFGFLLKDFKRYKLLPFFSFFSAVFANYGITDAIRYFSYNAPPFIERGITPLFDHTDRSSFPSGHASFLFALSTIIYFYNKKAGCWFFVLSFLVSISRVIGGIHWPFDILFGAFIGVLTSILIWKIKEPSIKYIKGFGKLKSN